MIANFVSRLTNRIIVENYAGEEMREWYEYSLLRLIETSLSMITVLLIGFVFGHPIPVAVFSAFLLFLRSRSGGFHCDKFWQCYLASAASVVVIEVIEPIFRETPIAIYILFAVSAAVVAYVGTVNHPNLDLSASELVRTKKGARTVLSIETTIIVLFELLSVDRIFIDHMMLSVIYCATLIVLAKIKKQEV